MPVEIGTYDQVKAILEDGEYQIGSKGQNMFHCVEEIVTLKIKKSTNSKTLNDLKELESKVVLIRDHSSSDTKAQHDLTEGILTADHHPSIVTDKLASKDIEKFLNVSSTCNLFDIIATIYSPVKIELHPVEFVSLENKFFTE